MDVDVIDIFISIARHLSQSLEEQNIRLNPGYFGQLFSNLSDFLNTSVKLETSSSLSLGIGKITLKSRESKTLRDRIRQYLEPQITRLLQAINTDILQAAKRELDQQGKKNIVVIIDNLDRLDETLNYKRRTQAEYLFIDRAEQLKQIECHVIYTVPLSFSGEFSRLGNYFGTVPEVLPMVPVKLPNGPMLDEGIKLLRQVVLARAFGDRSPQELLNLASIIFENIETLDRLCMASGGHIRNLLSLLYRCLQSDDPPISRKQLEEVINEYKNSLVLSILDEQWQMLSKVSQTKNIAGQGEYEILVKSLLVFEYQYQGDRWFDVNPVLKEHEKFRTQASFQFSR